MNIYRFVDGIHRILRLEAIGHHIELQLAHRTDDNIVIAHREKDLGTALFRQLANTILQLLGF